MTQLFTYAKINVVIKESLSKYYSNFLKLFILFSVFYWLFIYFLKSDDQIYFDIFGLLLGLLPIFGVILGVYIQNEWGGFKSYVGKSIIFITISLLMWFLGQTTYLFLSKTLGEVPYPGLPDYFFIFIDIFYTLSMLAVMKYSGAKSQMSKSKLTYLPLLIIPIASVILNIRIFFGDWSSIFSAEASGSETIFNLIYTFGSIADMAVIVITILFSFSKLGGKMRSAIYLLFVGVVFQYVGDVLYSYIEARPDFPINGNAADFVYFLSIASIIFALIKFNNFAIQQDRQTI